MTASFRIGRVAGVPVGVNWSVLVIFGFIAWGLAVRRFPAAYPGHSSWAYAAAGTGAAVVFFVGLLAHEVGHAVVAKRNGLPVDGITLWLFGGVARLQGEAQTPGAELRISGVGPLISFVIALLFGAVATGIGLLGHTGLAFGTFVWLAGINVALVVFNIIPAAPLDGGRLLRAALWKVRGDRTWAAVVATRAGQLVGAALIGVGLWTYLSAGAGIGGLWFAVIGWFLITAAGQELRQVQVRDALADVTVAEIMTADPRTVPSDMTVADFLDGYFFRNRFSSFPVVDGDAAPGLVTKASINDVEPGDRSTTLVGDIACAPEDVAVATPGERVSDLLPRLQECSDGRALVMEGDRLVGIVSPRDIGRALERVQRAPAA